MTGNKEMFSLGVRYGVGGGEVIPSLLGRCISFSS